MIKQVGESISAQQTVVIWECDQCGKRWTTDSEAKECPYCSAQLPFTTEEASRPSQP